MNGSVLRGLFKFDVFRTLLVCVDILIMVLAMVVAYLLMFDGVVPDAFQRQLPFLLGMALFSTLAAFAAAGVYSRRLPHLSETVVRWIVVAATSAEIICYASQKLFVSGLWAYLIAFWTLAFIIRGLIGVYASYRSLIFPLWQLYTVPLLAGLAGAALLRAELVPLPAPPETLPVSRTIHALYFFISTTGFVLGRWVLHWLFVYYKTPSRGRQRAILLGDGLEISFFTRLNDMSRSYHVVAVLDNDPLQWGMRIQNVRVQGGVSLLPQVAQQLDAQTVLMLKDSLSVSERDMVESLCRANHLNLVRLGSLQESLLRTDSLSTANLLERQEYRFLPTEQDNYLKGKRVLVTGAGGSIGSELVRQILRCAPERVVLLGRGENSIFELEQELKVQGYEGVLSTVIVNIADYDGLVRCFSQYAPQVVFHAAAHKHVPLMEGNIHEAVRNNVIGTWNVMDLAGKCGVERVVMISTDKAVAPASVMGATKRKAEQVVADCASRYRQTCYTVVRFGNVLGSRGSVVRIFLDQIRKGGPVTVTDPRMTRFFMTIPEAVSLVLACANMGADFGIYVLEMGKPYRIVDLAEKMIRLCGLEPGRDIEIRFTGVRPGEKLEEVLVTGDEQLVETSNGQIRRLVSVVKPLSIEDCRERIDSGTDSLKNWLLER